MYFSTVTTPVSLSISNSQTWHPLGKLRPGKVVVSEVRNKSSRPAARASSAASSTVITRLDPSERKLPSPKPTVSASTSSKSATKGVNRATTASEAALVAVPCVVTERDPPVPPPLAMRLLSPCTILTFSGGIPSHSYTNWL